MCLCVAIMGIAFAMGQTLLVGAGQFIAIIVLGVAAIAFEFLWFLRGPRLSPALGDDYWQRAWGIIFLWVALAAGIGAIRIYGVWKDSPTRFDLAETSKFQAFDTQEVQISGYMRGKGGDWIRKDELRQYRVPNSRYNHLPVAAGLLALLSIGAFGEYGSRAKRAKIARKRLREQAQKAAS